MVEKSEILKLPNAPLQEVIFEVKWDLDISQDTLLSYDSGFDMAVGIFYSFVKNEFKSQKAKFPPGILLPQEFLNNQPKYQYWTNDNTWPVMQLGHGIFTINDTEANYQWEKSFFPLIKKGLIYLQNSYSKSLNFNFVSLRYIDQISTKDYNFSDWLSFMKDNLNFEIENKFDPKGSLKKFQYTQVFDLKNGSELEIVISNGKKNNNEDILVWETSISNNNAFTQVSIIDWLDSAHKITSQLFKEICKDDLYNSFK